ncbi:tetratricopeptide repeat protein [Runella sp. SP2]|uniref:tetratricopeptide repeat-containing sensor histidine kinase n=1 Tax=Runella sp. SP2 TaxID=2268026 RepID=UPI000F076D32|nr:tetratricopeptide repeat protein [Runella sp. SP2]AYQ36098.1 hypothetical protein DTQ70_29850 [Runella sp. SP2]
MLFRKITLLVILSVSHVALRGQTVEEPRALLQKFYANSNPNARGEALVQLCDLFSAANQIDSIRKYAQWAGPLLPNMTDAPTKAWLEHYVANAIVRTYPDSSLQLNTRSLQYFTKTNDLKGLLKVNHALGIYQSYHGKPAKERAYYYEALKYNELYNKIYEPKRYARFRAAMHNNLSISYAAENDYEKSLESIHEVEKVARESQSDELSYLAAQGYGSIYSKTKQWDKCEFYYREALAYAEKLNRMPYIAVCLNNLGTYYTFTNKYDDAIKMYKRALDIAYQSKDWLGAANRLNNLGSIESVRDKLKAAEQYFLQSIEYADKIKAKKPRLNAMSNLARIYLQLDRIPEAQKMAQEAIVLAEELNDREVLSKLYNTLTKSYEKQNDFAKALVYQRQKAKMQDSILNEKSLAKIQELQVKYDTERKEFEIRELNRLNQIQTLELQERNLWFALLGVTLFAVVVFMAFFARHQILKKQNQVLDINQKLLRTQINPHFFFNVLSSIQTFLLEQKEPVQAISYLSKFAKLMRSVLETSRVEFISVEEEGAMIKNYLDIQKIRFGNQFDYEVMVEDNLRADGMGVPPMLAQPFLENALEHGIRTLNKKGKIEVLFQREAKGIRLIIKDNGIGRQKAAEFTVNAEKQSLATQITQERVAILNKQVRGKIDFNVEDLLDNQEVIGTQVTFHLPLIEV